MDDTPDLTKKPKTAPPLVKERNDTVNHEILTTGPADHRRAGPPPPRRISSEPYRSTSLPRVDVSENPKRDGGENEWSPLMRYPPRQFAATPDSERSPMVEVVEEMAREESNITRELGAARNDVTRVPEIDVESMTTTIIDESRDRELREVEEYQKEGEMEDDHPKRKLFSNVGKPVESVESPMKPRPSSPIPGIGRPPQIPFMAYVVGAAVEKNKVDVLGPDSSIYEQSTTKCSSPLTPHDKDATKVSLVAEIMQTDGNKQHRAPSTTGRYQPIGSQANDFSLLRPCEMNLYAGSRNRVDMQRSASQLGKVTDTKNEDDVALTKESDVAEKSKASKVLEKLLGKLGSDSAPVTTEGKKLAATDGSDSNQGGGLASTAGVLTSVIRWKTKKKLNTGTRESHEKYPGYLDVFNQLSHELMTSVPFPILLQTRREALPIIQNIAKAYKSTLGSHHQMTRQAYAKVEQLRSELQDNDVFL